MLYTKKIPLFFFLILIPFLSIAQKGKIKITLVDSETKEVVIGASAALLKQADNSYIDGAQSDVNGQIMFENVDYGTYALRITFLGMLDVLKESIKVDKEQLLDLGTIIMKSDGSVLEQIVVEGRVPDVQLGIDKKVFDVSQSLVSVGGSASDVLQNVPTIQVDSDGSVSLRGSTSVKILIDGKESAMAGSDVNSLLQSLPANSIAKVEVVTNPSSKYDAEGQSGIINIVLKKDIRTGLNGNVTATGGSYDNYSAGLNLNYRDRQFNFFGGYNYARRNNPGDSYNDNIQLIDGLVSDKSEQTISRTKNKRKNNSHTIRFGTDFYAAPKTTLSVGANVSVRDNDRRSYIDYQYFNIPAYGASSERKTQQYEDDLGFDITFDFKQELKREGEELTANITYGSDKEDGTNDYYQTYASGIAPLQRNNTTSESGRNWNFQTDYVLPFAENHKFEAGYRGIVRNSEDSQWSELMDAASGEYKPDYTVSNDFDLKNSVHALYANYQRMLSEKIGVQVGLRGEQTYLNSTYYNLDPDADEDKRVTKGKQDFFRVYPSLFLTYELGEKGDKVQMSYTRRVQRPRGWQVNPFLNISDETNYRQGNPDLLPEDIHSFELSFAKFYEKWNFITSAYYRHVSDMTSPFLRDPAEIAHIVGDKSNVTYSRWENVAKQDAAGMELISKVNLFRWWDATANVNVFYNHTTPYKEFEANKAENFSWNGNINTNVKFAKATSMQIRADYRAPQEWLQGKMKSMTGVDVALRQDILKGKGTVMFNVRDVFNTRKFRMENHLPNQLIKMEHRWMPRTFNLSFSYRFGIQDSNKKNNRSEYTGGDEEMGGGF